MINTSTGVRPSLHHSPLKLLPLFCLLLATLFAGEAQAAVSVTQTSSDIEDPRFYTNSDAAAAGASPKCNYLSFDVTNGSPAIADAWVDLNFISVTDLSMGGGDDGRFHFGPMAAGETRSVFYYVCSTHTGKTLSVAQTFNLIVYEGKPSAGGSVVTNTDKRCLLW